MTKKTAQDKSLPLKLLNWYDQHRRSMPWRAVEGEKPNPYHVWLSEIMLQQTTVATVGPYFLRFIKRWPTLKALSEASLDEINRLWAGLGYYRRARGLYECAQFVVNQKGGVFPSEESELLALPGIGPYTAAAIRAIAFNQPANVVDGNVERVIARLYATETPLPQAKRELKKRAAELVPKERCGDYAQALMDLGATVCTPRRPRCGACPWQGACQALAEGKAENLPRREKKGKKPVRYGVAFVLFDPKGRVLLHKRPATGLLAGMMGVVTTEWTEKRETKASWLKKAPVSGPYHRLSASVHHTFTHFELELDVVWAVTAEKVEGKWVQWQCWEQEALPSVMRKVLKLVEREKARV